jgi:hypothetical protein
MKTKGLAIAVVLIFVAGCSNVFGNSLILSGTAGVLGGGTLSFSDSAWDGACGVDAECWGGGGSLTITGGSKTLTDSINAAAVSTGGTLQLSIAVTGAGGLLTLILSPDGGPPQIGEAFTSNVDTGSLYDGGASWYFDSGTVSASDPTTSASEPWDLQMSLVFFGIVAGIFGVLIRTKVLHFAQC